MPVTNKYKRLPLSSVKVERDSRQRRELFTPSGDFRNEDGLLDSVIKHGVLQPIIVTLNGVLIAGERRLEASKLAQYDDIPVRYFEELEPLEARIVELEENIRRAELPWRDEVRTVAALHGAYKDKDPEWTLQDSIKALSNYGQVQIALRVAQDLDSPRIADAQGVRAAYNVLTRIDERRIADAMADIVDGATAAFGDTEQQATSGSSEEQQDAADGGEGIVGAVVTPMPLPPPESILNEDFCLWADAYTGQRFNFIHCDFPYGISAFNGPQSGRDKWVTYGDDKDTYHKLIEAFCKNLDKFCAPSAHIMFWLSADYEVVHRTRTMFRSLAPSIIWAEKPLIWHKTDNVGILSDPKRGPRHIYETALIGAREDRPIVRAVSDTYGAPTDKAHHPSTKPEPVLRHFLQMFVDENSRVFDPTCGSGSSLRAAESLGAKAVLGLEVSVEHCESARSALRSFRTLRKMSKAS